MRFFLSIPLFLTALLGCGGGGGGGGSSTTPPPPAAPIIAAEFDGYAGGALPPGLSSNSLVFVVDTSTGASITTATVKINGVTLAYDPTNQDYEGNVAVSAGGAVTLSVGVGTSAYTATVTEFTTFPSISTPPPSASWSSGAANSVMWTAGAPTTNADYVLGVFDTSNPNGPLVWPLNQVGQVIPTGTTSFSIPGGSITAGSRSVLVGIGTNVGIPNAARSSVFSVYGLNFVPITVNGMAVTARTSGTTNNLNGVIWSGSRFVAVGDSGSVLTSPDGVTWASRASGTMDSLFGVSWSGNQFVAVGGRPPLLGVDPGHGTILTSADGVSWTSRVTGTTSPLHGIAWTGAQFVAVGDAGAVLTSVDGITWTPRTSGTSDDLRSVAWSGTDLIAVGTFGFNSSGVVLSSSDGISWGQLNVNPGTGGPFDGLLAVAWSGTQFVAAGDHVYTATSGALGALWNQQTSGTANLLSGAAWSGTQFVVVGASGTVLTSPDGVTWTLQASGTANTLSGVTSSGTELVIVGASGTVITSP